MVHPILATLQAMPVYLICFENGHFRCMHLHQPLEKGVVFDARTRLLQDQLASINTDGLYLRIPRNVVLELPVVVVSFHPNPIAQGASTHINRHNVQLEAGAKATVWHITLSTESTATQETAVAHQVVSDITLGAGASLQSYGWQMHHQAMVHETTQQVHLARDSHFHQVEVDEGGHLLRKKMTLSLDGSGASARHWHWYDRHAGQHMDHQIDIQHKVPHTTSRVLYKGMTRARGKAVLKGRIHIAPHASGSDASLHHMHFITDPRAVVETQPELVIENDDVQCAHGAVLGAMDPEDLYYMRSRGLSYDEACQLYVRAFAAPIVENILDVRLRGQIERRLDDVSD